MSGLCGWMMSEPVSDPTQIIDGMTCELSAFDAAATSMASGAGWGLGVAGVAGSGFRFSGEDALAAVYGRPEILDGRLKTDADRRGQAAAFASAYQHAGPEFLGKLRGAFAIAISLPGRARTLLAVDRTGTESMYYAPVAGGVVFSTALRSLMRHSEVRQDVDLQSVFNYLYFHVMPSPDTIYQGVSRLQPGHYIEFSDTGHKCVRYWAVRFSNEHEKLPFEECKREFRRILVADIEQRVAGARQVGCFLSGGTDSSTIAGLVTQVTGNPAKTYSIGFAESGYDEMEYARIASRHFGTEHHEYYVTADDVVDLVPKIAASYGQPFGNSSAVPAYYCAAMARSDGIETMLGGDGGDELFGGNERYAKQALFALYFRLPERLRKHLLEPALAAFPFGERVFPVRKARRYIEQANMPMPARMESYNLLGMLGIDQVLDAAFLREVDPGGPLRNLSSIYQGADADTMLNRMLALDFKFTLADNDLPKVINMCELAGVRAEFPLFSDSLLEFSARLPVRAKVRNFRLRYFFKRALRDFLPAEIINKSKHGFGLPIGRWLISNSRLRELAFDSLSRFKRRGIIRASFIDELIDKKLREHPDYYGTLVWIVMILEVWYTGFEARQK